MINKIENWLSDYRVGSYDRLLEDRNKLAKALNSIIENCNLAEKHKPNTDSDEWTLYTYGQYLVIDNIRQKLIEDLK